MSVLASIGDRLLPRERFRRWVIARVARRGNGITPPLTLNYKRIFILPTQFGLAFAVLMTFTLLGGLNFNNNLALLLVFGIASLACLSNLVTFRNLVRLKVETVLAEPVFAGEVAQFRVALRNDDAYSRLTLQCALATDPSGDCVDLEACSHGELKLILPARHRGWLPLPPFRLESRYPLGLFRCWSWVNSPARCLVWPSPDASPPPLPMLGQGAAGQVLKGEGDQVHGLREYRPGDSPRKVAWRSSARHQQLLTREMETPRQSSCVMDFSELRGLDTEQRLSVLTAWVLQADRQGLAWQLLLPGENLGPARGDEHCHACLKALALFS